MVGLAALVAAVCLGLPREMAWIGPVVAVRCVLDQVLFGLLEPFGYASPTLLDGTLLFATALLEGQMLFFFQDTLLEVVGPCTADSTQMIEA